MRSIRELLQQLPIRPEEGLEQHAVADSARRFGINRLTPLPQRSAWLKFLAKFNEPIIRILLGATLLSLIVSIFQPERLVEGLAVLIAVFLATGVSFASEYRSEREFDILNAQKESQLAKTIRGGEFRAIPMEEIVVGDVVALEMGDEVCADGRLLAATDLWVDQSLMTGESEPVRKHPVSEDETGSGPDKPDCLYRGTEIVDGVGRMLVTEVGDGTELGMIARNLSADDNQEDASSQSQETRIKQKLTLSKKLTPLQQKLERLASTISRVGYAAAAVIFVAQLLNGMAAGKVFWTTDPNELATISGVLLSYVINMVIVIVVAVPEGLPMSVAVSLAMATRKMTRARALVRQLVACETIGSATVICTDKTGTLTQNKMEVAQLSWDGQSFERGSATWQKLQLPVSQLGSDTPIAWIAINAAVNSTARLEKKKGEVLPIGNSTEGSLLLWLREVGLDYERIRIECPPLYQLHFSSDRKHMTTVVRHNGRLVVLVKGSPEWVLAHSTHYQTADGDSHPWTPQARQTVERQLREAAAQAMRTLAFGYGILPPDTPEDEDNIHARCEELESGLIFVGFAAIRDPLRHDVKDALAQCRGAGIDVKMITGDSVETARAIALEAGLLESSETAIDAGKDVMTSDQLGTLSDDQVKELLPRLRIVARAKPLDKLRLVKCLQEIGEVVAVTGDGTNDAPALKKADVGLSMGLAGTAVAKEASKIVLLDDSFATIVKAVHWGRALYENIQRFLQLQLTINLSALVIYLLGTLIFHVEALFTVLQLLWINVIMDTLAAIALCSEPPRPGLMSRPPKKRDESIVTPAMVKTIFSTGAFFVVATLGLLIIIRAAPSDIDWLAKKEGLFFSVYVFFQVWNLVNCRSLTAETSGLSGILRNPTFVAIASAIAIGQIIIVSFGGELFRVEPLSPLAWLCIFLGTSSVLVFAEFIRRMRQFVLHR
jgi:P-type Ca2+ transporter type 2C